MARTPPSPRSAYRAFRQMQTRWMDNDEYGHMNNATYLSLFDTAVSLWQLENGLEIRGPDATRFLVVETGCRYFSELGFPDRVHAGLRIGHLGTSSFCYDVGLFRNDDDIASTEGFFAQVHVNADNRPAPIPAPVRAILAPLVVT